MSRDHGDDFQVFVKLDCTAGYYLSPAVLLIASISWPSARCNRCIITYSSA
jgi:hypothetical protein